MFSSSLPQLFPSAVRSPSLHPRRVPALSSQGRYRFPCVPPTASRGRAGHTAGAQQCTHLARPVEPLGNATRRPQGGSGVSVRLISPDPQRRQPWGRGTGGWGVPSSLKTKLSLTKAPSHNRQNCMCRLWIPIQTDQRGLGIDKIKELLLIWLDVMMTWWFCKGQKSSTGDTYFWAAELT